MSELVKYLLLSLGPAAVILFILLLVPEKIEKWSALLWKGFAGLGGIFRCAHKRYLKHDLQGRVNEFVKTLRRQVPSVGPTKLRVEWVDPSVPRKSIIDNDTVVLRLRRDDPTEHNFVHGAYLFVSGTLLRRPKRYLSPPQKEAVDLFVCTKLLEQEKPAVVEAFLEQYLHPKTEDAKSRVSIYVDDFAIIDSGSLFFPVFVQELEYLGDKVFGKRKDQLVITEVNGLIDFLKPIANRTIGDQGDLTFDGEYCRFGIVIVGKPSKLLTSVEPYVNYIRNDLVRANTETIYIIARAENAGRVEEICGRFSDDYACERKVNFKKLLRYSDRKELALQHLVVLRKRGVSIIQPSESGSQ